MPEPTYTPKRSSSTLPKMPLSSTACCAAARAYCTNRSVFLKSLFSIYFSGSKFLTSPATFAFESVASKDLIWSIPHTPFTILLQVVSTSLPSGVTQPKPVTTTLLIGKSPFRITCLAYIYTKINL